MTPLAWHPAPFQAGSINGEGLRRLLGATVHDSLSLLVRETIQNSWDASRNHDGGALVDGVTPSYAVSLRTATDAERAALRTMFGDVPTPGLPLHGVLDEPDLVLLEIRDRGTSGLGGPVDNSRSVPKGCTTDFIDLMFNIGAPQDTELGGGTFGFGKIASYAASRASTIVVHTRPVVGTKPGEPGESRLIASGIGDGFDQKSRRYTGRHWWGETAGPPTPLVGDSADRAASEIFESGFSPGETGTSILVIQPELPEPDLTRAAARVVSSLLWNAWPKLVPHVGADTPPMNISVTLEGDPVDLPDPRVTRPFIGFAASLQEVRRRQATGQRESHEWRRLNDQPRHTVKTTVQSVDARQPVAHVGLIAAVESMALPNMPQWQHDEAERDAADVTTPLHHIALMRQAELIVKYIAGPEHPDAANGLEWSGVFRSDKAHDRHFALAEPPSHDEWLVGTLVTRAAKVVVRRGREYGPRDFFSGLFRDDARSVDGGMSRGLADVVASHLGGLMAEGLAPRRQQSSGGNGSGSPSRVKINGAFPSVLDGTPVLVVDFEAPKGTSLRVSGTVKLAAGSSNETVDVRGWSEPGQQRPDATGDEWESPKGGGRVWLTQPSDATVSVDLKEIG
jgi:hypothetical protein